MKFLPIERAGGGVEKYARRSECGRYQVSKSYVGSDAKYTLWLLGEKEILGVFGNMSEVIAYAERHARKAS